MSKIEFNSLEIIDLIHIVDNAILAEKTRFDKMRDHEKAFPDKYKEGSLTKYNAERIKDYTAIGKKLHDILYTEE